MSQLEEAFDRELRRTYDESVRSLNYRPTYLLNMLNEFGGVETARRLLAKEGVSDGFTTLWERGRLDLAVESIVLKPEFAPLFTAQELDRARQRLAEARYTPPWLTSGSSTADLPGTGTPPSLVERLSRAVQNIDPGSVDKNAGITGAEAGLRGEDQIRIALQTMVAHGGEATIQQIYDAVEAQMSGQRLSDAGRSSLRYFVNQTAVEKGYVYPAAPGQKAWRITPEGRAAIGTRTASWIFQSNPTYFDLPGALAALTEMAWEVSQHPDKIHTGDTVYLWESGDNSGILAVARVLTEPADLPEDEDEQRFNRDSTRFAGIKRRVRLKIEYVLPERIRRDDLQGHPTLKDISIIRSARGTNFSLTEEQAAGLAELVDHLRELDREDAELEGTDDAESIDSLQEWQARIQPSQRVAYLFAHDYPEWLRTMFNGRVIFNALARQAFSVFVDGRRRMRGNVRQTDGVYVWLSESDPADVAFLRDRLSRPETVRPRTRHGIQGYRFSVDTPQDYEVLQALTRRLVNTAESPQDEEEVGDPAVQPIKSVTSLAEWQARTHSTHPIVNRAITELPAWLQQTLGNQIELRIYNKPELGVFVRGYWRIYFAFNPQRSLYVLFANPDATILERLRTKLSNPTSIKRRDYGASSGYRFFVNTEADYALLKQLILDLLADVAPPLPPAGVWPDPTSDRQAFVLFFGAEHEHQHYCESYSFNNFAAGDARKLADALQTMQQGGPPVEAIIYRPGPHYAFTAWARVTSAQQEPGAKPNETVWKLKLDPREFPVLLYLKDNAAYLSSEIAWLTKGLPAAFAFHSIRKIDATDFNRIIDAARAAAGDIPMMSLADAAFTVLARAGGGPRNLTSILEQAQQQGLIAGGTSQMALSSALLADPRFANLSGDMWLLAEPLDDRFVPQISAAPDAQFWRIHFPRELWDEARRNNVIGIDWPLDATTNQSVQRLKRINVGDRIVVYLKGGTFGGIGVVTHRYTDIRVTSDPAFPSGIFGGKYPQRIGVAWADAPAAPVDMLAQLREADNTQLYNRVRNAHTIIPISRDDYIKILTLLQVHDAGTPTVEDTSRLPSAWSSLAQFRDFVQVLDDRPYTLNELHEAAQQWGADFAAAIDPEAFADELRQLRVLGIEGDDTYRVRPYVAGDSEALARLMVLALLLPIEGTEAAYQLPARTIVPRLRAATESQPNDTFAPKLGTDGLQLLAWYAEAGLVTRDGDSWQAADDALAPLPGDDPASTMYNRYLTTLLAEIDGTLADGLPPIDGRPLEPVRDLPRRLNELAQDLLIEKELVLRVYRSLLAGRHVVLSGPPGTGKTELAKRLPTILWREDPRTVQRIGIGLDQPPVVEITLERHGYKPIVVTATEDWGVRDVVGGIAPRLNDQNNGLTYDIQHGHLTRVILQHFDGTNDGQTLPQDVQRLQRREYQSADNPDKRYRGAWLVIDEFTRAPVDAAFGSLLTTLGSSDGAVLNVPAGDFSEVPVPLPHDFRIIGTLNSFDRHFLNQMSEAMKRRFDFIDVPPPGPHLANYEQGSAVLKALRALQRNGFSDIVEGPGPQIVRWPDVIEITVEPDPDGVTRYQLGTVAPDAGAALQSFWRIFSAIRVFRQLGTAQAIAVYTNLFTGVLVGMSWPEALDTALADSLADQLQVLTRDEQRILEAYLEYIQDAVLFAREIATILAQVPQGRRPSLLYALREAEQLRGTTSTITTRAEHVLTADELRRVFRLDQAITLPSPSVFRRRLHDLINERGL